MHYPTLIGYPRDQSLLNGMDQKDFYTGFEAREKQHLLTLSSPIEAGAVTNLEALERILLELVHHELKCTFEERRILITEQPGQNTKD